MPSCRIDRRCPNTRCELELVRPVSVGKAPYVRFDGNDYSVPHSFAKGR